uniref:Uncharacterized protein n=1 Tax=Arundo donax TaxID=35708 RepID=A0A0A9FMT2_ARUDO
MIWLESWRVSTENISTNVILIWRLSTSFTITIITSFVGGPRWVSSVAYPNLFGVKGFVAVVISLQLLQNLDF